ncbi:hypothetical protein [Paraburkholderia jirisanensis]
MSSIDTGFAGFFTMPLSDESERSAGMDLVLASFSLKLSSIRSLDCRPSGLRTSTGIVAWLFDLIVSDGMVALELSPAKSSFAGNRYEDVSRK